MTNIKKYRNSNFKILHFRKTVKILGLLLLAYFSFLMLRILYLYIPVKNDTAFLQLKQDYITVTSWRIAFFTHVFTAIIALFAGFTQFSESFLRSYPKLHRSLGYLYVIDILMVTGPAALLMSFYANGGLSSQLAFIILSVLWLYFTANALRKVIKKNFAAHRNFMIRSYALTLSAITLRLWKVFFSYFTDIAPMDRYRLIAWLGWTLNLLIAEYIIWQLVKRKRSDLKIA